MNLATLCTVVTLLSNVHGKSPDVETKSVDTMVLSREDTDELPDGWKCVSCMTLAQEGLCDSSWSESAPECGGSNATGSIKDYCKVSCSNIVDVDDCLGVNKLFEMEMSEAVITNCDCHDPNHDECQLMFYNDTSLHCKNEASDLCRDSIAAVTETLVAVLNTNNSRCPVGENETFGLVTMQFLDASATCTKVTDRATHRETELETEPEIESVEIRGSCSDSTRKCKWLRWFGWSCWFDWVKKRCRNKCNYCQVRGGWGGWSGWSSCSRTCGGGTRNRYRSCNSPSPRNGGSSCSGSSSASSSCNTHSCPAPINCEWSSWSTGSCSKSCGDGQRIKSRYKTVYEQYGGTCIGVSQMYDSCHTQSCPATCSDGIWNQDETGIDCGGSYCTQCEASCGSEASCSKFQSTGWESECYTLPYEGEFCDSILDDVDYHCDNYIAPTVTFYSNNADLCSIDMNAGKSAAQSCLNQIKAHNADWYVNIVHGFGGNDENEWMTEIKLALLNRYATRNVLVGVVDWRRGADRLNLNNFFDENDYGKKRSVPRITDNTTNEEVGQEMRDGLLLERGSGCFLSEVFDKIYENYYKSAADTPIVGRFLGLLTKQIKEDNTHIKTFCIGHSLGAHVCGFSGKTLGDNVVDGIIGMDAAGPIFEVNSAKARLNINDAKKVQLFHTNYEFLGIEKPVGNFDIYVNGGSYQHCGGVVSLCSHSAYLLVIQLLEGNGHCDTSKGTMILADLDDLTPDTGSALLYTDVNGGSCYVEDWVCRGDELCCWRGECREGEGDCNMDRDCKGDLVCGSNNCPWDTDKTWLLNFRDDCCKVHTNQGTNVINTVIDTVIAHVDCLLTLSRHNCKGPDCKWVGFFWNFGICHNF